MIAKAESALRTKLQLPENEVLNQLGRTQSDPGPAGKQRDAQAAHSVRGAVVGKCSMRMKIKMAIKASLHVTRFRTLVSGLQQDIDQARQKADAWLDRNPKLESVGSLMMSRRGLKVGAWPSRFGGSMSRRRSSTANMVLLESSLKVETHGGAYSLSRRGSMSSFRGARSRRGSTLVNSCSDAQKVPAMLLALMQHTEAPSDSGNLSPATKRYLPGCGKKWVRTKKNVAVRLSKQGSGSQKLGPLGLFSSATEEAVKTMEHKPHDAQEPYVHADACAPKAAYGIDFSRTQSEP